MICLKNNVNRFIGVHNVIGAKIAEEKGFEGVWLSGLGLSAAYGVPDTNILPVSKLIEMCNYISCYSNMPILVDCDSGYGDYHNIVFLTEQLIRAGATGISIEDKVFPKKNSFLNQKQDLLDIDEYCKNIRAAHLAKSNEKFIIIARMEGMIAGLSVSQTIERAKKSVKNGADMIIIHSKLSDSSQIIEFMNLWDETIPVIVIPTTYYTFTVDDAEKLGIWGIIYANQGLRCSIRAMEHVYGEIMRNNSCENIENYIVSISRVFELQNIDKYNYYQKEIESE